MSPRNTIFVLILISLSASAPCLLAEDAVVKIEEILEENEIRGKVANLENPESFRILVYIKTDRWYIHPFSGMGEGDSWAKIEKDGSWSLSTTNRGHKARGVAALVVEAAQAERAPGRTSRITQISHHGMILYSKAEMEERGWFGKI